MLTLEVHEGEVFCHYAVNVPNHGGYLARIFPSGSFMGLSFDELTKLGPGTHDIKLNERIKNQKGNPPNVVREMEWLNFCYEVGTIELNFLLKKFIDTNNKK